MALTRVTRTGNLVVAGKLTQKPSTTIGLSYDGSHEVLHRHWMDYNNIGDGTYEGYILLCPAHPGSGTVIASEVSGTVRWSRGGTGSGNRGGMLQIYAKTAYTDDTLTVTLIEQDSWYRGQFKVTYNGTEYLALGFGRGGGGAHNGVYFDGYIQGTDIPLIMVRETDVSNPTAYGGDYAAKPAMRIEATNRTQRVQTLNAPFFDGYLGKSGALSAGTYQSFSQTSRNGITLSNNNERLNVPIEGYYLILCSQLLQPVNNTYTYFSVLVNGSIKYHSHNNFYSESNKDFNISKILHLQASDYIEIQIFSTAVNSSWGGTHSTISVHKLG